MNTNTTPTLFAALLNDEAGFIVSAELVLVATIGVIGLIVGLTEVAWGVNQELEDVGAAVGAINQSYAYQGTAGCKAIVAGSKFGDAYDDCDGQWDVSCDVAPTSEGHKNFNLSNR